MGTKVKKFKNPSSQQLFEVEWEERDNPFNPKIKDIVIERITIYKKDDPLKPMITAYYHFTSGGIVNSIWLTRIETYTNGIDVDSGYTGPTAIFDYMEPAGASGQNCEFTYLRNVNKPAYKGSLKLAYRFLNANNNPEGPQYEYKNSSTIDVEYVHLYDDNGVNVIREIKKFDPDSNQNYGKYQLVEYEYTTGVKVVKSTYEFETTNLLDDYDQADVEILNTRVDEPNILIYDSILHTVQNHFQDSIDTINNATKSIFHD